MNVTEKHAYSLSDVIDIVLKINPESGNILCFRGESKDYGATALQPSIYHNIGHLRNEHKIYHEIQRFNELQFKDDDTTYARLLRIQHHMTLTRLLDVSEDIMNALYFALEENKEKTMNRRILYVLEIEEQKIKYYDSDAVSVVANLACSPLKNETNPPKSKETLWRDAKNYVKRGKYGIKEFNQTESVKYLLHDIKAEKSYFEPVVVPEHIFSVFYVKPKYSFERIRGQKGAALLFGLNYQNYEKCISLLDGSQPQNWSPVTNITKIYLEGNITLADIEKLGINKAYIYPDMQNVGEYLKQKYSD